MDNQTGLPVIEVDVLISGAGPAGASLGCFLASHGKSKSICRMSMMRTASLNVVSWVESGVPMGTPC